MLIVLNQDNAVLDGHHRDPAKSLGFQSPTLKRFHCQAPGAQIHRLCQPPQKAPRRVPAGRDCSQIRQALSKDSKGQMGVHQIHQRKRSRGCKQEMGVWKWR